MEHAAVAGRRSSRGNSSSRRVSPREAEAQLRLILMLLVLLGLAYLLL